MHIKNDLGIQLIGIAGRSGAGKDTIAEHVEHLYTNVYTEHLADPLKRAAAHAFGIPIKHFHYQQHKEVKNDFWDVSPRQIAQFVGTEMFRDTIRGLLPAMAEFWIHRLEGRITGQLLMEADNQDGRYERGDTIIIPDVRFQDEHDWVVRNGGIIIHVVRPQASDSSVGIPNHSSERVDGLQFNVDTFRILNDEDIASLEIDVEFVIESAIKGGYLELTAHPTPEIHLEDL